MTYCYLYFLILFLLGESELSNGRVFDVTKDCTKHNLQESAANLGTEADTRLMIQWLTDNNGVFRMNFVTPESEFQIDVGSNEESALAYIAFKDSEAVDVSFAYPVRLSFRETRMISNLGFNSTLQGSIPEIESFDLELAPGHVYFNCRQRCFRRELDLKEIFSVEENKIFYLKSKKFNSFEEFSLSICDDRTRIYILPSSQIANCSKVAKKVPIFDLTDEWTKVEFRSHRIVFSMMQMRSSIVIDDGQPLYTGVGGSALAHFEVPDIFEPSWIVDCLPEDVDFADDEFKLLFAANGLFIRSVNGERDVVLEDTKDNKLPAVAVDYEMRSNCLFSTINFPKNTIEKKCGGQHYKLVKRQTADGLAIDWITGNIYWAENQKHQILVCDRKGQHMKVLIGTNLTKPRGLALNPSHGYLYWTDWGDNAYIGKAGMDGSNRKTIIQTNSLKWPNAITFDFEAQEIYWCDGGLDQIVKADINGNHVQVIKDDFPRSVHLFGLSIYNRVLYYTDWGSRSIMSLDLNTNATRTIDDGLRRYMAIKVVHRSLQPNMPDNPCEDGGGCEALCLLAPGKRRACA